MMSGDIELEPVHPGGGAASAAPSPAAPAAASSVVRTNEAAERLVASIISASALPGPGNCSAGRLAKSASAHSVHSLAIAQVLVSVAGLVAVYLIADADAWAIGVSTSATRSLVVVALLVMLVVSLVAACCARSQLCGVRALELGDAVAAMLGISAIVSGVAVIEVRCCNLPAFESHETKLAVVAAIAALFAFVGHRITARFVARIGIARRAGRALHPRTRAAAAALGIAKEHDGGAAAAHELAEHTETRLRMPSLSGTMSALSRGARVLSGGESSGGGGGGGTVNSGDAYVALLGEPDTGGAVGHTSSGTTATLRTAGAAAAAPTSGSAAPAATSTVGAAGGVTAVTATAAASPDAGALAGSVSAAPAAAGPPAPPASAADTDADSRDRLDLDMSHDCCPCGFCLRGVGAPRVSPTISAADSALFLLSIMAAAMVVIGDALSSSAYPRALVGAISDASSNYIPLYMPIVSFGLAVMLGAAGALVPSCSAHKKNTSRYTVALQLLTASNIVYAAHLAFLYADNNAIDSNDETYVTLGFVIAVVVILQCDAAVKARRARATLRAQHDAARSAAVEAATFLASTGILGGEGLPGANDVMYRDAVLDAPLQLQAAAAGVIAAQTDTCCPGTNACAPVPRHGASDAIISARDAAVEIAVMTVIASVLVMHSALVTNDAWNIAMLLQGLAGLLGACGCCGSRPGCLSSSVGAMVTSLLSFVALALIVAAPLDAELPATSWEVFVVVFADGLMCLRAGVLAVTAAGSSAQASPASGITRSDTAGGAGAAASAAAAPVAAAAATSTRAGDIEAQTLTSAPAFVAGALDTRRAVVETARNWAIVVTVAAMGSILSNSGIGASFNDGASDGSSTGGSVPGTIMNMLGATSATVIMDSLSMLVLVGAAVPACCGVSKCSLRAVSAPRAAVSAAEGALVEASGVLAHWCAMCHCDSSDGLCQQRGAHSV